MLARVRGWTKQLAWLAACKDTSKQAQVEVRAGSRKKQARESSRRIGEGARGASKRTRNPSTELVATGPGHIQTRGSAARRPGSGSFRPETQLKF